MNLETMRPVRFGRRRLSPMFLACGVLGVSSAPLGAQSFVECTRVLETFEGESSGDLFGWVSSPVPDVNGDGAQEVLVSATGVANSAGRIYLYSGKTGAELFRVTGAASGARLGAAVRDAGDVNGDGVADVIAGAPGFAAVPGQAFVYSGVDGSELLPLQSGGPSAAFGSAVTGIGDVNGDGFGDVAVGGPNAGSGGAGAGKIWVFSGLDGALLWSLVGEAAGDAFGSSLGNAGDLTGDGRDELIVGAPSGGPGNRGKVYVYDTFNQTLWWDAEPGPTGVGFSQFFVASVGDVNANGTPDVYVADFNDNTLGPGTGRMYVFEGADGAELLNIAGDNAGDGFGIGRGAGDVNADGHADLLMCGWTDSAGAPSAGQAQVISGADGSVLRVITSSTPGDTFGFDAHGVGDVDGDGRPDYFVTGANNSESGLNTGKCYLIAGAEPILEIGTGTAGTGGIVPTLSVTTCLELGTASTLEVADGLAGAAGWVAYGALEVEIALAGGTLYVLPDGFVAWTLDGSGSASLSFQVPLSPALAGSELFLQGLFLDAGAVAGVSLSAGLRLIFG